MKIKFNLNQIIADTIYQNNQEQGRRWSELYYLYHELNKDSLLALNEEALRMFADSAHNANMGVLDSVQELLRNLQY